MSTEIFFSAPRASIAPSTSTTKIADSPNRMGAIVDSSPHFFILPPSSIAQKNPPPARIKSGAAGARGLRAGHALNGDREDPVDQCARSVSRQSLQRDCVQTFLAVILDRVRRRENARGIR